MKSKADNKAASRVERSVSERPKSSGLKVKTNIKAGPHVLLASGGD